jgi:putative PEP-CTERM system histidine kinase
MAAAVVLLFAGAALCAGLAAVMLLRDARLFVARVFATGMAVLAMEAIFNGASIYADTYHNVVYWQRLRFLAAAFIPGVWLVFSLSFARRNYHEFLKTWRWGIRLAFLAPLGLVLFGFPTFFVDVPFSDEIARWSLGLGWGGQGFFLLFLLEAACILMNLERTLRASTGSLRWQIKFMILGVGSFFAARVYTGSQVLLFSRVTTTVEIVNAGALVIAGVVVLRSFFRLRLFSVNFYLSQTALYNSLTVLAMGGYLLLVGLLAQFVTYVGGEEILPFEALVVFLAFLLLTLFLISDEWRQRSRLFISRHFQRPQYDYRKEWMTFTQRTTSLLDSKEFCDAVVKRVSETFGVSCVTVWLLEENCEQLTFGGSTVFPEIQAQDLRIATVAGGTALIQVMREKQFPIDFDGAKDDWTGEFYRVHARSLREARIRYCVSLNAGRELLGIMTLNERVTRMPLSVEDADLLKTVADQAAASLSSLRLSRQLLKAKELEAFQTLSTFFIHDLKNLASTLSLTLQNLPIYFDDPEFRADALRVMTNSVQKINSMCSRLSSLTKGLDLQKERVDLNGLITTTLADLDGAVRATVARDLHAVPVLIADPEQIQKVLVNLLLNANDAIGTEGKIAVSTEHHDEWAILAVTDTGAGMSKDFLEHSLFQPFHTTKSKGLGIGLFHSKKIIEAHRGRIEVESEPGKGTTFRVFLPIVQ